MLRHKAASTECLVILWQARDCQLLFYLPPFPSLGEHGQPGVLVPAGFFPANNLGRRPEDPAGVRVFLSSRQTFLSRCFPVQAHLLADFIKGLLRETCAVSYTHLTLPTIYSV